MDQTNSSRFPEQDEPNKVHGTTDDSKMKEKFQRESGKIEDSPSHDMPKMNVDTKHSDKNESSHLTDRSGEEKKEDYINTDERKKDLDRRGL
jgi:hypothetical protein